MQNQALKDSAKVTTETENSKEIDPRSVHEYNNYAEHDKQGLTVEVLGSIVCCLCFETNQHVARVSAFSTFGDQSFLCNVIQICFGLVIQEADFCTDICEQCLVRIDVTWQFYNKVNANSKALNDLYNSMQYKVDVKCDRGSRNILKPARKIVGNQLTLQQKKSRKKKSMTKPESDKDNDAEYETILEPLIDIKQDSSNQEYNSDSDSLPENPINDSDSDSLPEHPFFTDHTKSVYNCHLCPQTFDRAQTLHVHQLNAHQTDTEQILCHLCAKWFKPRHYNEHVRNIHLDEKCVCTICGQKYSNTANLQRHILIHTKEKPYTCKLCDAAFNQSTILKLHVSRVHMGIKAPSKRKLPDGTIRPRKTRKPHPCELCDYTFVHTTSLEKHVSLVHMGKKPLPKNQNSKNNVKKARASRHMLCPVCDQSFFLQSKLITHLDETHPDHKTTIIRCDDCPERFLKQRAYYNHRLYHHSNKAHKCDKCGKIFNCAPNLYTHRKKCYENNLSASGNSKF